MGLVKTWEQGAAVCCDPPEPFQTKALALSCSETAGLIQGQGRPADPALASQTPPDWETAFGVGGAGDEDMKPLALVPSILWRKTVKTQSVILDILIEREAYTDSSRKQYVYTSV